MTTERPDLESIRARTEAATSGPWKAYPTAPGGGGSGYGFIRTAPNRERPIGDFLADVTRWKDAEFSAAAREDVPRLLDYCERLEAALAARDAEWAADSAIKNEANAENLQNWIDSCNAAEAEVARLNALVKED